MTMQRWTKGLEHECAVKVFMQNLIVRDALRDMKLVRNAQVQISTHELHAMIMVM